MTARRIVGGAVLLVLALPGPAAALEATAEEVRDLAARATEDPEARARLEAIDSVDGTPVDLERALEGAEGEQLEARLETLAGDGPADSVDPERARAQAESVLEQGKFQSSELPRPFKGLLDEIGERLRPVGDWLADLLNDVTGGHPGWGLVVLLGIAGIGAAIASRKVIARRARRASESRERAQAEERASAAELESRADTAERKGDLETALRLRFRAGLIRLAEARAVPPRASLTSGELKELLRSKEFEEIAATFDEVVYGRRPARAEDVASSRAGWQSLLRQAKRG